MAGVPAWDCPRCNRRFSRRGQSHECAPAMTIEEYFSTGPAEMEKPIFEAVMKHLDTVGPVHVEPVSVGIFLKRARSFVQLRTMQKWVALSFSLPHRVDHPLMKRKPELYHGRGYHVLNVRTADEIDDQVKEWLTEAYLNSPPE